MTTLYHGSGFLHDELMPGYQRSGELIQWDETESNKWLYATTNRQMAIGLGLVSAIEKRLPVSRAIVDGEDIDLIFSGGSKPTRKDIESIAVYLYSIELSPHDGWVHNQNQHNQLKTEYRTTQTIGKNHILKVEKIDLHHWLSDKKLQITLESINMSNQLYLAHQVAAMEASNPLIPGLELFGRVGPAISDGFKHALVSVSGFFSSHEAIPFDSSAKKAETSLTKLDFAGIMDVPMPVPEGFKGNMNAYGILLVSIVRKLGELNSGLDSVVKSLSVVVSNPSMPVDTKGMAPAIFDLINEMDSKEPMFAEYLDPHVVNHTLPFCQLVPRNKDWAEVVKTAEELNRAIAVLNKKDTLNKASEIERLLNKLIAYHKQDKYQDIPGDWLEQLSSSIYNIAKLLEWYSVIYYRAMAYLQSVQDTGKKLITMGNETAH